MLVLSLLVSAVVGVASSHPIIDPPPPGTVWTVFTTVEAVIVDDYAVVRVIADIGNRGPDPEFPFQVIVPADAFVSGLTIERDGTAYEAEIRERGAARVEYEAWKAAQQTGGLVEKQRGTTVYAFLVNVAEFTSVRATLTYEQYIPARQGFHELVLEAPVSGFGQDTGARFDAHIVHGDGLVDAWGWSPDPGAIAHSDAPLRGSGVSIVDAEEGRRITYAVGPRWSDAGTRFVLGYAVEPTDDDGSLIVYPGVDGERGSFLHRFRAPTEARELPLDLVLVLDTSGSMSGLKIEQLKDAARQVVGGLDEEDTLHLVFFSSDTREPWPGLAAATEQLVLDAQDEIGDVFAGGGTNIEAGIRRGFRAFENAAADPERLRALVFLTDGMPTVGLTDHEGLRELARGENGAEALVFALAFGSDADFGLAHWLAADGGGTALRVPEGQGAEVDLRLFMGALTTPVLKDVRVEYEDDVEAFVVTPPVLFAGSEFLVVGTFGPGVEEIRGTVTALAPDGERRFAFSEDVAGARGGSFLSRLVAYHRILRLQQEMDAGGISPGVEEEITALALAHGFVTDLTSLVLTLDAREDPVTLDPQQEFAVADDDSFAASSGAPRVSGALSSTPSSGPFDPALPEGSRDASGGAGPAPNGPDVGTPGDTEPQDSVPFPALLALVALAFASAVRRRRC